MFLHANQAPFFCARNVHCGGQRQKCFGSSVSSCPLTCGLTAQRYGNSILRRRCIPTFCVYLFVFLIPPAPLIRQTFATTRFRSGKLRALPRYTSSCATDIVYHVRRVVRQPCTHSYKTPGPLRQTPGRHLFKLLPLRNRHAEWCKSFCNFIVFFFSFSFIHTNITRLKNPQTA